MSKSRLGLYNFILCNVELDYVINETGYARLSRQFQLTESSAIVSFCLLLLVFFFFHFEYG